ncbi:MAG TPA: hypothetical protein VFD58_23020 [Blastocatellia bacterium]|nr:hypothetical protein [Blastocatellia bacterium]
MSGLNEPSAQSDDVAAGIPVPPVGAEIIRLRAAAKIPSADQLHQQNFVIAAVRAGASAGDKGGDDNSDKKSEGKTLPVVTLPVIEPGLISPLPITPIFPQSGDSAGFQWGKAYRQALLFTAIQHGFRLVTEPSTRADLKGPFFSDWINSVRNLRGWRDGDPFLVNYIGHPMQGAVTGFIQIHNDPRGIRQEISRDRRYWESRFKALAWSAVWSTQFELGPFSESSIGNVGLKPSTTSPHPLGWVDLIITPTVGTAWLIGEDALDRWVVRPLERRTGKYPVKILIRTFLNPSRSFANILRGKWFWYRDDR